MACLLRHHSVLRPMNVPTIRLSFLLYLMNSTMLIRGFQLRPLVLSRSISLGCSGGSRRRLNVCREYSVLLGGGGGYGGNIRNPTTTPGYLILQPPTFGTRCFMVGQQQNSSSNRRTKSSNGNDGNRRPSRRRQKPTTRRGRRNFSRGPPPPIPLPGSPGRGCFKELITPGLDVWVVQKQHQRSGEETFGTVDRLLTNSPYHPRGIKVMLDDGKVGRVTRISSEDKEKSSD